MRREARLLLLLLLPLAGLAPAQEDLGRDTGEGPNPVLFVTWRRTTEAGEISGAGWQALEPHYGVLSRLRLASFDGSVERAHAFFDAHTDARAVVAFDARSAEIAASVAPDRPLLRVGPGPDCNLDTRVDRARLAELMRLFRPETRTVALFGPSDEELPGLEVRRCAEPAEAEGCGLTWIAEGATIDPATLQKGLDVLGIPLVSTNEAVPPGRAALTVRPDPQGLGLHLAAMLLRWARHDIPWTHETIARLRVSVDLRAAARAGYAVPLAVLARADQVGRTP